MTNEQSITFEFNGDKMQNLQLNQVRKIDEGSTGTVYLMQRTDITKDPNQFLVLKDASKIYEDNSKSAEFTKNARELMNNPISYFVNIKDFGEVTIGEDTFPAIIMKYEGSNLSYVNEKLPSKDIDENVVTALRYKAMLTMVDALEAAHKKNEHHGDLHDRNVVCELDFEELFKRVLDEKDLGYSIPDLERDLLSSEIKLCDRTTSSELESLSMDYNATFGRKSKDNWAAQFFMTLENSEKTDILHALLIYAKMTPNSDVCDWSSTIRKEFGLKKFNLTNGFPTLKTIKNNLMKKIKEEKYFFHEKKKMGTSDLVLRPIDKFRLKWNDEDSFCTAYGGGGLEGFFETDKSLLFI